ncbi:hypothetical protein BC567DRAFT_48716 [Phyllosticta citribraziliensis]
MASPAMDESCRNGYNGPREVNNNNQSREADVDEEAHEAEANNGPEALGSGSETIATIANTSSSPGNTEVYNEHPSEHGFPTISGVTYQRLPRLATVPGVRLVGTGHAIHPGWVTPSGRMVRERYWSLECPMPGGYWRIVRRYRWVRAWVCKCPSSSSLLHQMSDFRKKPIDAGGEAEHGQPVSTHLVKFTAHRKGFFVITTTGIQSYKLYMDENPLGTR